MTTQREKWTLNEATGEVKDCAGNIVADVTASRVGRRIAAVPDYEAALLLVLERGSHASWIEDGVEMHAQDVIRAALRKGGRIP